MVGDFLTNLSMSAQTSPAQKGLNPGLMCQESYACSGTDEAVFECDECCSLQCLRCEEELHRQERLRNHERIRLKPGHIPYCDPCKGPNGHSPGVRQRAAVRCQTCKINLCLDCQKRTHSGGNKRKHPVTVYNVTKVQELLEEEKMDEETKRKKMTEKVVSFLLVDENEEIQVTNEEDFIRKLDCKPDQHLKVVSIFGNTGDGKSHTLNHTFFYGREVFKTSPAQESCTVGVWAAYDPVHKVAVIDTEGLLGATVNLSQRTRLLLKVLAISDLVIYRTHADRLHNDLFKFLGDASEAYLKHFTKELKATTARCGLDVPLSTLGPAVIIFHETVHTQLLGSDHPSEVPEKLIQDRFRKLGRFPEAFSSIHYKGTRTYNPPTDFSGLRRALEQQLENNTTRSPRHPGVIFKALKALSDRFSGEIPDDQMAHSSFFPDEYFTCSSLCLSCGAGCKNSMNHGKEGVPHEAKSRCSYSHQYDNRVYTCKTDGFLKDNNNAAQRLLDGVNFMAQSVSELSLGPTKAVTSWLTDQIAPAYWRPNSQILSCSKCAASFKDNDTKHHCRACGEGFCDGCSSKTRPVPERGWGPVPVRVCDNCYEARNVQLDVTEAQADEEGGTLIARKVGEAVQNTLGAVVTAIDIPLGLVKDAARPAYWVPDHEILHCHNCRKEFSIKLSKHHCRACGQGFCDECSHDRRAVPSRGWDHPVRVCFNCNKKPGDL
ncbi:zinc finger FYVE domain-containing protein 1 isoform X2 [Phyllostomus discolor]|uniref:Zinc finger FYVE domain-containing protein 1 n=1 Tax=Phyllostomus discolor TaxID=89673 RepID=A0A7E6CLA7_9CHIR|nr:zinc finger FYVE domain-containing protein 1 isoform X2 [Phyllostomus discolor]